nr:hypothetical protein [Ruminococcus sp.]
MVKVGLINNRHPMPVQNYIFEKEIEDEYVPQVIFSKNRWRI